MRFAFSDEYKQIALGDYVIQKGRRAKGNELKYPAFSINNQTGFSEQTEQWGEASYTKLEKNGYKVIECGDFAYNPARINVGSIGLYNKANPCIVSSLYVCFSTKQSLNPNYLFKYLKSDKFNKKVLSTQEGGVRAYFFFDKFQKTKMWIPSLEEQQKVGKFLNIIDERIETQNKILNGLESLRFSLSYILFRHLDRYSKLEDIANIIKGKQINGDILNDDFSYPVYNGGINASGFYNKFNSENCITISEGGNSCGTVRFVKDKFWSGGHNYVIVCKNGIIDQFLYYYLKHNENKIMSLRVGSGLPNIQKSSLSEFKIKITNIEEQKKIAAKLGAIDSKINNEKKLLELFQKQKIFLLNNLFI